MDGQKNNVALAHPMDRQTNKSTASIIHCHSNYIFTQVIVRKRKYERVLGR